VEDKPSKKKVGFAKGAEKRPSEQARIGEKRREAAGRGKHSRGRGKRDQDVDSHSRKGLESSEKGSEGKRPSPKAPYGKRENKAGELNSRGKEKSGGVKIFSKGRARGEKGKT